MPTSEHGIFENPQKSAYSLEYYDSKWEMEYMKELEAAEDVAKWTKNHGVRIGYLDIDGKYRTFTPDFLVEKKNGAIELHEIKGTHLLDNPNTQKKVDAAKEWCKVRSMQFRIVSRY